MPQVHPEIKAQGGGSAEFTCLSPLLQPATFNNALPCYISSSTQQSDSDLISHSLPLFHTAINGQLCQRERKATHHPPRTRSAAPARRTEQTKHFTSPRLTAFFPNYTHHMIWTQGKLSVWCGRVYSTGSSS